jgi:hypothetical protein
VVLLFAAFAGGAFCAAMGDQPALIFTGFMVLVERPIYWPTEASTS